MPAPEAPPIVILDDATPGNERTLHFRGHCGAIVARGPADLAAAFERIECERRAGRHLAGYLSYELGYLMEPRLRQLLPEVRNVPLLWFGVFEGADRSGGGAWVAEPPCPLRAYASQLRHEWSAQEYGERFEEVHRYISDGDIYQANLSFRSRFAFAGDPLALYRRLRERSKAAFGAYIDDGERQILSLSPEMFFVLSPEGRLMARPMKGTIARGHDSESDGHRRAALASSEKNRAENLMIVDLLRNDLGRVAELGSVRVEDLFAVETYPTLHTMVSTIEARMRPGLSAAEVVRAIFPSGSVTGAPKIRAMEILRGLEASPRGVYCGSIGHFAPDGSAQFNVAIRTVTIEDGRGELGIGGAVVRDSVRSDEYEECLLKAKYYDLARLPLELFETLRWSADNGYSRLERHLGRMEKSAAFFRIPFDRESALASLNEAVASGGVALRVRLVLDESGVLSAAAWPLGPAPAAWTYSIAERRVRSGDALALHKTSWRRHLDDEHARLSRTTGCDEVIFLNERGEIAEGSRSTVFLCREGAVLTPPLCAGILDGCLRREMIEQGGCSEASLTPDDLKNGSVFFGNSLRGLIPAKAVQTIREFA